MPVNKLKFLGKDGHPFIMNVPARDLSPMDLQDLAAAQFNTLNYAATAADVCAFLIGSGLYAQDDLYTCPDCGKSYKTWDGYNQHVMNVHVVALETNDALTDDLAEDNDS